MEEGLLLNWRMKCLEGHAPSSGDPAEGRDTCSHIYNRYSIGNFEMGNKLVKVRGVGTGVAGGATAPPII